MYPQITSQHITSHDIYSYIYQPVHLLTFFLIYLFVYILIIWLPIQSSHTIYLLLTCRSSISMVCHQVPEWRQFIQGLRTSMRNKQRITQVHHSHLLCSLPSTTFLSLSSLPFPPLPSSLWFPPISFFHSFSSISSLSSPSPPLAVRNLGCSFNHCISYHMHTSPCVYTLNHMHVYHKDLHGHHLFLPFSP